jgi:hypothetical protein
MGCEYHEALEIFKHRVERQTTQSALATQTFILTGCARVKSVSGNPHLSLMERARDRIHSLDDRELYRLGSRDLKNENEIAMCQPQA